MAEATDEKYTLAWTEFQSTFSNSLELLRRENAFHDVTLVSDDEVHMNAHKVVLSAASSFFKRLLKRHPHQSPLLYLSGVQACDLQFILDYVYQGQVHLYQNQVNSFLVAAAKLKIAGLTNLATQQVGQEEPNMDSAGQESSLGESHSKEETMMLIEKEASDSETVERPMLKKRKGRGRPRKETAQHVYSKILKESKLEENPDKAETMRLVAEEILRSKTVERRSVGKPKIQSTVPVMSGKEGQGQRVMYYKEYEDSEQNDEMANEYDHQDSLESLVEVDEQKPHDPLFHEIDIANE